MGPGCLNMVFLVSHRLMQCVDAFYVCYCSQRCNILHYAVYVHACARECTGMCILAVLQLHMHANIHAQGRTCVLRLHYRGMLYYHSTTSRHFHISVCQYDLFIKCLLRLKNPDPSKPSKTPSCTLTV